MRRQAPKAPENSSYARLFESLVKCRSTYAGATGSGGLFTCPAHTDENASLAVDMGDSGVPLMSCMPCTALHGRDGFIDMLRGAGVRWGGNPLEEGETVDWGDDVATTGGGGSSGGGKRAMWTDFHTAATYEYRFSDGALNFTVLRKEPNEGVDAKKRFLPFRHVRGEGRVYNLTDVERTPYHLERFEKWADRPIYLVEGEKAADALFGLKRRATTFHGGAAREPEPGWTDAFTRFTEVRLWPDADEVGVAYMARRYAELEAAGVWVSWWGVEAGLVSASDDAFDVVERGQTGLIRALSPSEVTDLAALKPGGAERQSEPHKPIGGVTTLPGVRTDAGGPVDGPYPVAALQSPTDFTDEYLSRLYTDVDGVLTLRYSDGRFWLWEDFYRPLSADEMRSRLARDLRGAVETVSKDGGLVKRPITVNTKLKNELVNTLTDETRVSRHSGTGELLPATGGVPMKNGWLDVATGELEPLTPARDVRWVVPGDYDPDADDPEEWLRFLNSIGWTSETQEYRLLRQWMGYLLSGSTEQQKAAMLIGPPRAGKGTILKVCEAMLGEGAAGIDLSAFSTNFGLSPIIGKGLAIVDDARFDLRTDKALVRRILSLVAEGTMSIDIKYAQPISARATARLMMATNEIPKIIEASSALASRFVMLRFDKSFLDVEDVFLTRRLLNELPGIVKWALAGLADLNAVGRFSETDAGREVAAEMNESSNPLRMFVEDECQFDPEAFTTTKELYDEYRLWADTTGQYVLPIQRFTADLEAAYTRATFVKTQHRMGNTRVRGYDGIRLNR